MKKKIVLDLEANGLKPTKIWTVVVMELGTSELREFRDPLSLGEYLLGVDEVIGHNVMGYDMPVLKDLWDIWYTGKVTDTLVMSRLANPQREGGHSLREWGLRLKMHKGDHSDWSRYSHDMLVYCQQDVRVTEAVYKRLHIELRGFSEQSINLEHEIQREVSLQERNGWLFDEEGAIRLLQTLEGELDDITRQVHERFRPRTKEHRPVTLKKTKGGAWHKGNLKFLLDHYACVDGDPSLASHLCRVEYREFNLGSRKQIAERLILAGWKPPKYTDKGNVIVDESTLGDVNFLEGKLIARYLMLQKRIAMVHSWLDHMDSDGRIHGQVNALGTQTNRMTASNPNLQQVVAGHSEYGQEMRSLFIVPQDKVLVGADLSGLELRCLAHYMKDPEYTRELLGGDIHIVNGRSAGFISDGMSEEQVEDGRNKAKRFIYAFLYGGGDQLIGSLVGAGRAKGKKIKEQFLQGTPALAELRAKVEKASRRGYLRALDDRRIYVRSPHSALNFLLQSAGSIIAKTSWARFHALMKRDHPEISYKQLGVIHDEIQIETDPETSETVGKTIVKAMEDSTGILELDCTITGKYMVGRSWSDTH